MRNDAIEHAEHDAVRRSDEYEEWIELSDAPLRQLPRELREYIETTFVDESPEHGINRAAKTQKHDVRIKRPERSTDQQHEFDAKMCRH